MMTITDTRTDVEKHLHEIWPSDFFIWNDDVYRRVEDNIEVTLKCKGEGIPAVHQRSGEIDVIDREALVVPCRCELIIIE